jgi:hypothetical protein
LWNKKEGKKKDAITTGHYLRGWNILITRGMISVASGTFLCPRLQGIFWNLGLQPIGMESFSYHGSTT